MASKRLSATELMRLLRRALVREGKVIPQTEAEVALFEKHVAVEDIDLPAGLRDPLACLDKSRRARVHKKGCL